MSKRKRKMDLSACDGYDKICIGKDRFNKFKKITERPAKTIPKLKKLFDNCPCHTCSQRNQCILQNGCIKYLEWEDK